DHDEARLLLAGLRVREHDRALMALHDRLHDREPQAAAARGIACHAVKTLEHALALGHRDAASRVDYQELHRLRLRTYRDRHRRFAWRVAKRVVDEILDQRAQLRFAAHHHRGS